MSAVRKKTELNTEPDDLRPEYDFSQLPESRPRGYYAARYAAGTVITPDSVLHPRQHSHSRIGKVQRRISSQVGRLTHRHSRSH